jgi:hypothetical protein
MRWLFSSAAVLAWTAVVAAKSFTGDRLLVILEEQSEREKYSVFLEDLSCKLFYHQCGESQKLELLSRSLQRLACCHWHAATHWHSRLRKLAIQLLELDTGALFYVRSLAMHSHDADMSLQLEDSPRQSNHQKPISSRYSDMASAHMTTFSSCPASRKVSAQL